MWELFIEIGWRTYVDSVVAMKDLHEFQKMFVSSKQSFDVK